MACVRVDVFAGYQFFKVICECGDYLLFTGSWAVWRYGCDTCCKQFWTDAQFFTLQLVLRVTHPEARQAVAFRMFQDFLAAKAPPCEPQLKFLDDPSTPTLPPPR